MDLAAPIKADKGEEFTFTVRDATSCTGNCLAVRSAPARRALFCRLLASVRACSGCRGHPRAVPWAAP